MLLLPVRVFAVAQVPPPAGPAKPANITVKFVDIGLGDKSVRVVDVWSGRDLGTHETEFTAVGVAYHDTAFLTLTPAATGSSEAA